MLYGNESISYYSRSNVTIWMVMAFQAGMINVGAFLACHRFVSHVTGFATFFGSELQHSVSQALGMLLVPLFFLLGTVISGVVVDLRLRLHKKPRYYISFGIIFFLLLFVLLGGELGFFGPFGEGLSAAHDHFLMIILCLVCGLQNGTVTSVSRAVIRTTHLTGITTDLGIGIVRYFNRHRLKGEAADEGRANLMRIGIIFFFGLGSVFGGFLFVNVQYMGFIFPVLTSGVLFIAMLFFQIRRPVSKPIPDSAPKSA